MQSPPINHAEVTEDAPPASGSPVRLPELGPDNGAEIAAVTQADWLPGVNCAVPSNGGHSAGSNELELDLAFLDQVSTFSNVPLPSPNSEYSVSTDEADSEESGWDGLLADDVAPLALDDMRCQVNQASRAKPKPDKGAWWPLRAKEYLISSLIIGHTRTIISRQMFNHVRLMFRLCRVLLPDWTTIRRGKAQLRKIIAMDVVGCRSVLSTPLHYLSLKKTLAMELGNPWVAPHVKFYPEFTAFKGVSRLSQSSKWLTELNSDNRAQMIRHDHRDYYIYELAQLISDRIVVPIFFYESGGEMYAKCVSPDIEVDREVGRIKFKIAKDLPFNSPELGSNQRQRILR
ncbi:uncharacterized protein PGTG_16906 [Puccinia graminis f. sp. tritici CRL 75-36-700-3]|uniref:Uncharacterized protein n=1 Tax=Puccinia graminis f. sp. tritici (strain CRL 75-36-700-3 / race SCCL) TaxID=418459 RepID=E3L3N6_PUCGT|nr:uncharacterized protein PGTG_16906 [Puccinia graminis f. sp. tritici CRL 75-36-700-3]EFP91161.2 hypothetical protein PGTG_16906 [Puccinia graminis f. sp. tritici CRL 75-36-700-3]